MSILQLYSSGAVGVLCPIVDSDSDRLLKWYRHGGEQPVVEVSTLVQRGKSEKCLYDCAPVVGCLGLLCVNDLAREKIRAFSGDDFECARIADSSRSIAYWILKPKMVFNPFSNSAEMPRSPDGGIIIRAPVEADVPNMSHCSYRLPAEFEDSDAVFCGAAFSVSILRSGISGVCSFDQLTRAEKRLWGRR